MSITRLKLTQYLSVLRQNIPGQTMDAVHQSMDGIEEVYSFKDILFFRNITFIFLPALLAVAGEAQSRPQQRTACRTGFRGQRTTTSRFHHFTAQFHLIDIIGIHKNLIKISPTNTTIAHNHHHHTHQAQFLVQRNHSASTQSHLSTIRGRRCTPILCPASPTRRQLRF